MTSSRSSNNRLGRSCTCSRQVIEHFQREAQEEADQAAKNLADSWARRAACPAKNSSNPTFQVRCEAVKGGVFPALLEPRVGIGAVREQEGLR